MVPARAGAPHEPRTGASVPDDDAPSENGAERSCGTPDGPGGALADWARASS